ncbi:phosphotransferase [Candidatus Berkelbacteria bacterium]|nr:phosphotransferase [Candidatus Berkelbacteria bacterium]
MRKLILTKENIPSYLAEAKLPFAVKGVDSIEEAAGGYNNFVFRATVITRNGNRSLILKQARPFNRRAWLEGKKVYESPERVIYETAVLKYLRSIWGKVVPKVYATDKRNYILILEDIAHHGEFLPDAFARGELYAKSGAILGKLLGKLHYLTYQKIPKLPEAEGYASWAGKRLHRHFLQPTKKYAIKNKAAAIYRQAWQLPASLTWFDPIHRNIFLSSKGKVRLIDFEEAQPHDPAWDIGILTAAWLAKTQEGGKLAAEANTFLKQFERAYRAAWKNRPHQVQIIFERVPGYQGIYLLSRVDNKRGSYFAHDKRLEQRIRKLALALIKSAPINNEKIN